MDNSHSSLSDGNNYHSFDEQRKRKRGIDPRMIRSSLDVYATASMKPLKALTQPKEFNFATAMRARPTRFLSPEEREQQELESRVQFTARPLPANVRDGSSTTTLVSTTKRAPTEPQSPMLHTTARLGKKRRICSADEESNKPSATIAQHIPTEEGHKKRRRHPPRPFQLMTEQRGKQAQESLERAREDERRREEALRQFRARPLPEAKAFQPLPAKASCTKPKPYPLHTDQRGQLRQEELARRLEEERRREEELRRFNARPLPCLEPFVPQPSTAPLTEPQPFPLRTEERGAEKVTLLQLSLAQAADQDKENRHFKALPLPAGAPFKPLPSTRPLTELQEFNLQSDSRASQRAAFDEKLRAKEAAEAEAKRLAQLAREREEQREVRRLRKQLVHKPRPIPLSVYNPMQALPSGKALTEPSSPCLHTKRRRLVDRS